MTAPIDGAIDSSGAACCRASPPDGSAGGATLSPKRPRGRPPSSPFKPTGHIPTFDTLEVFFKRAPEPTLSPEELAARLGIKVIDLQNAELPRLGGRFSWRAVCRCL